MAMTAVFLAEGFEEIEALTVVDLLRRARIGCGTVSITEDHKVTGSHKIPVIADQVFAEVDFDNLDMIILPGGMPGTNHLKECEPLKEKIRMFDETHRHLAAICAAPTVFGEMGLLEGRNACCFPGLEDGLVGATALKEEVVVDGHFITSRGMGTAIPFGLEIIRCFQGREAAKGMAERIVYGG